MGLRLSTTLSLVLLICSGVYADGDPAHWTFSLLVDGVQYSEVTIGSAPGATDGYDGEAVEAGPFAGLYLRFYRQADDEWVGPTGFYQGDRKPPIAPGNSTTWHDLYLGTGDASALREAGRVLFLAMPEAARPPSGYWARLWLDYVPASLDWTGPWQFDLPLNQMSYLTLPVPVVSDALDGTRMHITVYAPIPEPSSLLALLTGLVSAGAVCVRRRRR